MKVILTKTVPKVGKEDSIVNVANGFARNYLFPRGLAIVAERKQVDVLERKRARMAAKSSEETASAQEIKEKLDGAILRIPGQVGSSQGKLFGSVTTEMIAKEISGSLGVEIDKRRIALVDPIRRLGTFSVQLDLHREVDAEVTVIVFDPSAPVEAATEAVVEPSA